MLLTTHYLEEAEILCDRIAIMDHGKILELGTVDELVDRRFHERAVRFDAIEGLDDARLEAMPGVASVAHEDGEIVLYTRDVPAHDRRRSRGRRRAARGTRQPRGPAGDARGRVPRPDRTEPP